MVRVEGHAKTCPGIVSKVSEHAYARICDAGTASEPCPMSCPRLCPSGKTFGDFVDDHEVRPHASRLVFDGARVRDGYTVSSRVPDPRTSAPARAKNSTTSAIDAVTELIIPQVRSSD